MRWWGFALGVILLSVGLAASATGDESLVPLAPVLATVGILGGVALSIVGGAASRTEE